MNIETLFDAALFAENEQTRKDAIRSLYIVCSKYKELCNNIGVSDYSGIYANDVFLNDRKQNLFDVRDYLNNDNSTVND